MLDAVLSSRMQKKSVPPVENGYVMHGSGNLRLVDVLPGD